MQKANCGKQKDEQDDEKETVTVHSSFKVVLQRAIFSLCDANLEGRIKVKKERKRLNGKGVLHPWSEFENPVDCK